MDSFYQSLFGLDRDESRGDWLLVRVLEMVMVAQVIMYVWRWASYMPRLTEVILPLGLANYMDVTFLFEPTAAMLNAALVSLLLLAGFLDRGRFTYLLALLFFHFQYVARYSQGEISHGSNLTAMVLLSFGLAAVFFQDRSVRRKVAFGFVLFFTGLGYVSAAFSKLIGTGPTWSDGVHMYLWMGERSIDRLSQDGQFEFNFLQQWMFDHYWLSTAILTFGLLVELSGFLLWFRKTRWLQATLLISMHVGIHWTMNIFFGPYIYLLLLVGYPWNEWADWLLNRSGGRKLVDWIDHRRSIGRSPATR